MSTNSWSLGGEPPEPQYMPVPTPEEAEAIRAEVQKVKAAEHKKFTDAIARGEAAAAKASQK